MAALFHALASYLPTMKMNIGDWIALVAMLSSDKSLAYWHRMNIPLPRSTYQLASRYAAACLEVFVFAYLSTQSLNPDYWVAWEEYRKVENVVPDEVLQLHREISNDDIEKVFSDLETVVQFGEGKAIFDWANNWFTSQPDPALAVVENLLWLFDNENISRPEIHKDNIYSLSRFCRRVKRRNDSLREHFGIATHVYKMTLPTEREMLLQDVFFEGTRSSYWWMDSVEYSLQFIHFRQRWSDLKEEMGDESLRKTLEWARANQGEIRYTKNQIDDAAIERLMFL